MIIYRFCDFSSFLSGVRGARKSFHTSKAEAQSTRISRSINKRPKIISCFGLSVAPRNPFIYFGLKSWKKMCVSLNLIDEKRRTWKISRQHRENCKNSSCTDESSSEHWKLKVFNRWRDRKTLQKCIFSSLIWVARMSSESHESLREIELSDFL